MGTVRGTTVSVKQWHGRREMAKSGDIVRKCKLLGDIVIYDKRRG